MKWLKRRIRKWLDLVSVREEFTEMKSAVASLNRRVSELETAIKAREE